MAEQVVAVADVHMVDVINVHMPEDPQPPPEDPRPESPSLIGGFTRFQDFFDNEERAARNDDDERRLEDLMWDLEKCRA